VCGLPRLAIRSAVAVATFMFTGAVAAIASASFPASAALINRGTSSWGPVQALALAGQSRSQIVLTSPRPLLHFLSRLVMGCELQGGSALVTIML